MKTRWDIRKVIAIPITNPGLLIELIISTVKIGVLGHLIPYTGIYGAGELSSQQSPVLLEAWTSWAMLPGSNIDLLRVQIPKPGQEPFIATHQLILPEFLWEHMGCGVRQISLWPQDCHDHVENICW